MPTHRNSRSRPSKAFMAGAKAVAIYRIPAPRRAGPTVDENPLLPFLPKVQRLRFKAWLTRDEDPPWYGIFENINWDLLHCPKMVWHPSSRPLYRSTLAHGWRIFRFYCIVLNQYSHFIARMVWRRMPSPIRQGWIDAGYALWGPPPSYLPLEVILETGKDEDNVFSVLFHLHQSATLEEITVVPSPVSILMYDSVPATPASVWMYDSAPATPVSVCMAIPQLDSNETGIVEEKSTRVNALELDLGSPVNSPPPARPSRLAIEAEETQGPTTSRQKKSNLVRRLNPFFSSASGETEPSTSSGSSRASKRARKVTEAYDAEASGEDEL